MHIEKLSIFAVSLKFCIGVSFFSHSMNMKVKAHTTSYLFFPSSMTLLEPAVKKNFSYDNILSLRYDFSKIFDKLLTIT